MLIFLLADLRALSAAGNIRTRFEHLSLDSDEKPRLSSEDYAGFGTHGTSTKGVTARHIMAVLLLEIVQEAEEQRNLKEMGKRQKKRTPLEERPAFLFLDRPSAQAANFKRTVEDADGMPTLLHCYNHMVSEDIRKKVVPVSRARYPLNEELVGRPSKTPDRAQDEPFALNSPGYEESIERRESETSLLQSKQKSEDEITKLSPVDSTTTTHSKNPLTATHFKPTLPETASSVSSDKMPMPQFLHFGIGKGKEQKEKATEGNGPQLDDQTGAPQHSEGGVKSSGQSTKVPGPRDYGIRQQMEKIFPTIQRAGTEGAGAVDKILQNQTAHTKDAEQHLDDMAQVQNNLLKFASLSSNDMDSSSDDEIIDDTVFVAARRKKPADELDSLAKEQQTFAKDPSPPDSGNNIRLNNRVSFEENPPNQSKLSNTSSKKPKTKKSYHSSASVRTLMKEAIEARDPSRLAFIQGFFRPGTVSHALASSQSEMVWLNDWNEKYDCTYGLSVDRAKHKVLVCFRGAYTSNDWKHVLDYYDTGTTNPVLDDYQNRPDHIRLHAGFHKYLFRVRKDSGTTKVCFESKMFVMSSIL